MCFNNSNPIGGYYPTTQNTSSNSNATSSGTTAKYADPLAALGYTQALQNAMSIASTPYEPYQGQMVAGFTPSQLAAQQGYQNAVGSSSPYYTASQNLYNQVPNYFANPQMNNALNYYSQGVNAANNTNMGQATGYYNASLNYQNNPLLPTSQKMYNQAISYSDPNNYNEGSLSRYMNPYQQQVVDATMNQLIQTEREALGQNTQNAVLRGSYGGSGQFMGKSQVARQQALANAQALAGLNSSNYAQAQQQYNQQQAAAIQAQQQAAGALGQLGYQQQTTGIQALQNAAQGLGALGYQNAGLQTQALQNAAQGAGSLGANQQQQAMSGLLNAASGMSNLGTQQQQSYLQALNALNQSGAQQQALQQAQLQNAYQQWQQAKAYPYQQASFFSGLASGLGPLLGGYATTNGTSSQSGTGASIGMQPYANQSGSGGLMGLLTTGIGAALSPFGLKDGGRVTGRRHFADGGTDGDEGYEEAPQQSFGTMMNDQPYTSRNVASPKDTFAALAGQHPYGGQGGYATEALKLSKIIPSARQVATEELTNEIAKALGAIPELPQTPERAKEITQSFFGSPDTSGFAGDGGESAPRRSRRSRQSEDSRRDDSGDGSFGSLSEESNNSNSDVHNILIGNGEQSYAYGGRARFADGGDAKVAPPEAAKFVSELYPQDLRRVAEQGGFDYWTNQLQSGKMTKDQVANAFVQSPEYQGNLAARNAPPPPPKDYTDMSNPYAARTINDIMNSQTSSDFNKQLNPSGNTGMGFGDLMKQVYANSPGPQWSPEQQGMEAMPEQSYYQKSLPIYSSMGPLVPYPGTSSAPSTPGSSNTAPTVRNLGLATTMANASDADFVRAVYSNYLNRNVEDAGLQPLIDKLAGGAKRSDIEAGVAGAPEALNAQYVSDLYAKIFGRTPDAEGAKFWRDQLAGGMSAADVQHHFLQSPERKATSVVQGYYPTIQDTRINPVTGLANLKYVAPYKSKMTPYTTNFASGGRVGRSTGGRMSLGDIARAALQAGATPREAAVLTSIAVPESGRNAYAHNPNARTGDNSYGLWQINMLGRMGPERRRQFGLSSNEQLYDPVTNARAALQLLRGRGGLSNWTTYSHGKNRPYYSAAVDAVNNYVKDPKSILTKIEAPAPLDIRSGGEPNRASVMYGPPPARHEGAAEPEKGLRLSDIISSIGSDAGEDSESPALPPPQVLEAPIMSARPVIPALGLLGDLGGDGADSRYLDRVVAQNRAYGGRAHFAAGGTRDYKTAAEITDPEEAEAYNAGNSATGLMYDIGSPIDYVRSRLRGFGRELTNADMGSPIGTQYQQSVNEYQRRRAEAARLRQMYPEAFTGGSLAASEFIPTGAEALLGAGAGVGSAARGAARGARPKPGFGGMARLAGPSSRAPGIIEGEFAEAPSVLHLPDRSRAAMTQEAPAAAPRNVGPSRSQRPMSRFEANQGYMTTRIPGDEIYASSVGRGPRTSMNSFRDAPIKPTAGIHDEAYPFVGDQRSPFKPEFNPNKFDQNAYDAWVRGRYNRIRPRVDPAERFGGFDTEMSLYRPKNASKAESNQYEGPMVTTAPGQAGANSIVRRGSTMPRSTMIEGEFTEVPNGRPFGWDHVPERPGAAQDAAVGSRLPMFARNAAGLAGGIGAYKLGESAYDRAQEILNRQPAVAKEPGSGRQVQLPPIDIGRPGAAPAQGGHDVPRPPRRPAMNQKPRAAHAVPKTAAEARKYWGDWRDTAPFESDPLGNFVDEIIGDRKRATRPGNIDSPRSPYGGYADGGEVRGHYGIGGSLLGGLSNLFGGGSLGGGSSGSRFRPGPISQGLMTAGLGMMASPSHSALRAIGEGGIAGIKAYNVANDEFMKEQEELKQKMEDLEFERTLRTGPKDPMKLRRGGAARRKYAAGGGQSEDTGPFDVIGDALGSLGDTIGSALMPSAEASEASPRVRRGPGPISQGLMTAGLGMMASPSHSGMRAIGEGGLRGIQAYQTARAERDKEDREDAERASDAEFTKSLRGAPPAVEEKAPAPKTAAAEEPAPEPKAPGADRVVATDRKPVAEDPVAASMRRLEWLNSQVPRTTTQERMLTRMINEEKFKIQMAQKQGGSGVIGILSQDEFGRPRRGWISGPKAGTYLDEMTPNGGKSPVGKDVHGEEFLSTLNSDMAGTVRAIAEGRSKLPTGPRAADVRAAVYQYDPKYKEARYNLMQSIANPSGTNFGATIERGNTAITHLGEASDAIEDLKKAEWASGKFRPLNALQQGIRGSLPGGFPEAERFNTAVDRFVEEGTKFYRGSGGNQADIQRALHRLNSARSPQELHDILEEEMRLFAGKVNGLRTVYDRTMSSPYLTSEEFKPLSDSSEDVIKLIQGRVSRNFAHKVHDIATHGSGSKKSEGPTPVATGDYNGRTVTKYSDGSIRYSDTNELVNGPQAKD